MKEKNYFIESEDFVIVKIDNSKGFNLYCEDLNDLFNRVKHLIREISLLGVKSLKETFVIQIVKGNQTYTANCIYDDMNVNDFKKIFE